MKNKIITTLVIMFISMNIMASGTKSFKIIDNLGRQFNIEVKIECIVEEEEEEEVNFDTKKIFEENTKSKELIDITPFIKPEKEIEEELPF